MIYYLGEYARIDPAPPILNGDGKEAWLPIIIIAPPSKLNNVARFESVTYRGKKYAVPLTGATLSEKAGRSSQTSGLVQQLLNLNRTAKDPPATPLLRVLN